MIMAVINSGTIMKSLFKYVALAAIAATAFVSCQEELTTPDQPEAPEVGEVQIKVTAVPEALAGVDTRTYIDNTNTILWGTGEYMKLCVTSTAGENTENKWATSSEADANGQSEAIFEFSVLPQTAASYLYQGLYPASAALTSNNNNDPASYKVLLPEIQNATASSYDPAAYIMVTKPETFNSVETEWTASYRRATALNKVTLTGINDDIISVEFTAPEGVNLAGRRYFDLSSGSGSTVYEGVSTVNVKYASALSSADKVIWFTSWNAEIAEGQEFKIVAKSATKSYTRTLTARSGGINFKEGYLNKLSVNMASDDTVVETISGFEEGEYLILAKHDGSYFALKNVADGDRRGYENYSGSLESYLGEEGLIWTVAKSGNNYTISNGGGYLGTRKVSSAVVEVPGDSYTTNNYVLAIDENENGTYKVSVVNNPTWVLAKNNNSDYGFAFYAGTGYPDLVFVPATVDTRTPVTLSFSEDIVSRTTADCGNFNGQQANASTSVSPITYKMDGDEIGTITESGVVSLDGVVGTATVTASFAGNDIYKPASASYTISVTSATGPHYNLVSTPEEVVAGDYVITWNNSLYLPNTLATSNPAAGNGIVVSGSMLSNTVTEGMVWTFEGDNTDGFIVKSGTNRLISSNKPQGISIATSGSTKWTVSIDDTYGMLLHGNDGGSRYLAVYNNTDWRYYAAGNDYKGKLRLYKLEDNRTPVTLSFEKTSYIFEIGDSDYSAFVGQSVTSSPIVSGITYSLSGAAIGSINTSTGAVVLNGTAGEATVTASFAGDGSNKPATASYTISVTAPAATIADALSAPGTYEVPDVAVYAVKGNALILGDASGKIYAFKSNHGLSVGDVRTVSGSTIWYNSGDVYEFDAPTFSGSGTTTISHGTAVEFADNAATLQTETGFASTGSGAAHTAVYVHAIGVQSSRNITTSNGKVLYLSATESATDGKTVEVYGYVYAYSASHTNFNFLATSIEEYVDPNAKSITALKSSITGISADGVTDATETGVYSLTNASDSDVTVTPDGTVVTSASVSGGALTYSVAANTGAARSGSVTLAVSGGNSIEITISQDKASSSTGGTMTVDFESVASSYSDWIITNIVTKKDKISAHGGSYYGNTNGKESGSIETANVIANPGTLTFYVSKESTNTNASSVWKVSVKTASASSWTQVGDDQAAASGITNGQWTEVTRNLSSYSNVYVKIEYSGSTAIRAIDDVSLTYN